MRDRQAMQMPSRFGTMGAEPAGRALRPGRWVTVSEWEQGLLFRHGRLDTVLAPGRRRVAGPSEPDRPPAPVSEPGRLRRTARPRL